MKIISIALAMLVTATIPAAAHLAMLGSFIINALRGGAVIHLHLER